MQMRQGTKVSDEIIEAIEILENVVYRTTFFVLFTYDCARFVLYIISN